MKFESFIKDMDEWSSHRLALWYALEATKHLKLPVLELGCGDGSTPFLREYCAANGLELFSYDYSKEWADKFGAIHVTNWDVIPWRKDYSVVLVDESPGEHRRISIMNLEHCGALVVHDSEPVGHNGSDYRVREEFDRYRFVHDFEADRPKAWTTYLSNFYDIKK